MFPYYSDFDEAIFNLPITKKTHPKLNTKGYFNIKWPSKNLPNHSMVVMDKPMVETNLLDSPYQHQTQTEDQFGSEAVVKKMIFLYKNYHNSKSQALMAPIFLTDT